jgi:predicted PurR-regulated permease PerM
MKFIKLVISPLVFIIFTFIFSVSFASADCSTIVAQLTTLMQNTSTLGDNIYSDENQISQTMTFWYQQLSSEEGSQVDYSVIGQSASNVADKAQSYQTSFQGLNAQFANLLGSLTSRIFLYHLLC